jgi:hypothetical protein
VDAKIGRVTGGGQKAPCLLQDRPVSIRQQFRNVFNYDCIWPESDGDLGEVDE